MANNNTPTKGTQTMAKLTPAQQITYILQHQTNHKHKLWTRPQLENLSEINLNIVYESCLSQEN